jgi:hypothetical protein
MITTYKRNNDFGMEASVGEFSAPPMVFSSDGCYVELKIDRKDEGLKSHRYRVTAKGTHDTNPEVLTRVMRDAMTKVLGSPPSAMPYAEYSGRIEFTWDGVTTADQEALLTRKAKALIHARRLDSTRHLARMTAE